MLPQIAAVVIERSLHRPRSGMPANWRVERPSEPQQAERSRASSSEKVSRRASNMALAKKSAAKRSAASKATAVSNADDTHSERAPASPGPQLPRLSLRLPKRIILVPVVAVGVMYVLRSLPVGAMGRSILRGVARALSPAAGGEGSAVVVGQASAQQRKERAAQEEEKPLERLAEAAPAAPAVAVPVAALPPRVDIQALEQVRNDSPLDSLHLNYLLVKSKYN